MVAVAISAFRRVDTLQLVFKSLVAQAPRIDSVYVGVDRPREVSPDHEAVRAVIKGAVEFSESAPFPVQIRQPREPLGLGTNVLATASWMFSRHGEGIFLEDDCVPGDGFFNFVDQALPLLKGDDKAWMVCGSQYLPASGEQFAIRSPLPLIWGWASASSNWQMLLRNLHAALVEARGNPLLRGLPWSRDRSFWESGLRHVAFGGFDTWDVPIVAAMQQVGACAYLPSRNLVSNIGDGMGSVNIQEGDRWVRCPAEPWLPDVTLTTRDMGAEQKEWLLKNVHGVRASSALRARVSAAQRRLAGGHNNRGPLLENWALVAGEPSSAGHFVDILPR